MPIASATLDCMFRRKARPFRQPFLGGIGVRVVSVISVCHLVDAATRALRQMPVESRRFGV